MVNNSRSAVHDVYDFLQKFFVFFLSSWNKFVVSGGSYGGSYIPDIATVIHVQNQLLTLQVAFRAPEPSSASQNPKAHFTWLLHYRCTLHSIYDSPTCQTLYAKLPASLESIDMAFEIPILANRLASSELCGELNGGIRMGLMMIPRTSVGRATETRRAAIRSSSGWIVFSVVTRAPGLAPDLNFTGLNLNRSTGLISLPLFRNTAHAQTPPISPPVPSSALNEDQNPPYVPRPAHHAIPQRNSHPQLTLSADYIGAQDANCAWPGVFSFVAFLAAPDVPWPSADVAIVRTAGSASDAGSMAYIGGGAFQPSPQVSAEYVLESVDNAEQSVSVIHTFIRRALSRSNVPVIAGAFLGAVALGSIACFLWLFFRRRKRLKDQEREMDLVSRPFPLSVKPRLPPIITNLPPPLPIHNGVTPRRTRRKAAQPQSAPPSPAPQHAKPKKEGRRHHRSSISESIRGLLPPISQGYGVGMGLRTTRREETHTDQNPPPSRPSRHGERKRAQPQPAKETTSRRERSSISKSILGRRWNLPPVAEGYGYGYGVGLRTGTGEVEELGNQ
ncbi:hypothetical protein C8R45DRAFT_1208667 [Mycena sanguinolenta]|nr:hypothetical protein C8R45DRAFT_1208667 [Mycena sanguinolenta]